MVPMDPGLHGSLAPTMMAMALVLAFVVLGHVTALLPSVGAKCVRVLPLKWPTAQGNGSFSSLYLLLKHTSASAYAEHFIFFLILNLKCPVIPKNCPLKVLNDLHIQELYSALRVAETKLYKIKCKVTKLNSVCPGSGN